MWGDSAREESEGLALFVCDGDELRSEERPQKCLGVSV